MALAGASTAYQPRKAGITSGHQRKLCLLLDCILEVKPSNVLRAFFFGHSLCGSKDGPALPGRIKRTKHRDPLRLINVGIPNESMP